MTTLLDVADELYALSPGEFTTARNERAKQVKGDGDKDLAERIRSLRKPSLAAWVVNMLVRHDTEEMAQVLDLGVSLRQAQADLDGQALRELTRQRRQLTAAMSTKARRLAAELGEKVSETVARQVEDTLHAAMVDEDAAVAVRSGLLTEPLASTGLGTLDISETVADRSALGRTASPAPELPASRPDLSVVPEPEPTAQERQETREAERQQARAAADEAREAAERARGKLEKAARRAEKLQARSLQLQGRMDELRRQLADLEHRAESLDDELDEAEGKRERAEKRHRKALAALERAEAALRDLDA